MIIDPVLLYDISNTASVIEYMTHGSRALEFLQRDAARFSKINTGTLNPAASGLNRRYLC
jgi:hypothetical protein